MHVLDASRVVGVVSALLDPGAPRAARRREPRAARSGCATQHAEKERKPLLPIADARANRAARRVRRARDAGVHRRARRRAVARDAARVHRLAVLLPRLGAEGQVPGDPRAARGARALRRRAASCSTRSSRRAAARRAASTASGRRRPTATISLSTMTTRRASASCASSPPTATRGRTARLADYVAPGRRPHRRVRGHRRDRRSTSSCARFEAEHDDYRSIMAKALADRLAEAFAEYLHEVARREWYETGPKLRREQLIAERFRGIRPAFGYPACPDHSEKGKLFELLGAEQVGHRAHRVVRDAAGRERQRHLPRRIPRRGTSPSAGSAATRSRTTRRARACRSTRSSAGCGRTSPTSRRRRRDPRAEGRGAPPGRSGKVARGARRRPSRMRTTLKRGMGRAATLNGNGRAVLPPPVLEPMRRYRQPPPPPRSKRGLIRRGLRLDHARARSSSPRASPAASTSTATSR